MVAGPDLPSAATASVGVVLPSSLADSACHCPCSASAITNFELGIGVMVPAARVDDASGSHA
jgi:hypothetical protein